MREREGIQGRRVYYTREEGILYKGEGYTIQGKRVNYTREEGILYKGGGYNENKEF